MKLDFTGFQAAIPRRDSLLLPEQGASDARNLSLTRSNLQPLLAPLPYRGVTKPGDQLTIYRFAPDPGDPKSGFIFSWPKVVDVCKGPVAGNNQELTYWTGDGPPSFTDNSIATGAGELPRNRYTLGVPDTNLAPKVTVEDKPALLQESKAEEEEEEIDQRLIESRDYVVTFVASLGSLTMEGPPSNASDIVDVSPKQQVKVTHMPSPPAGNYPWTSKRLYRRLQSGGATSFALVAVLDASADTFTDNMETKYLPGDTLVSWSWYPPPEDMHSLTVLSNGLMFGARDNDICVSEPYLPHAWNPNNRYPLPHKIVGLGACDNNIVAVTEKNPYLLMGSNPAAMTTTELTLGQGCLSKRSIVSANFGCCYASPDGMVLISGGGSSIMTEPLFTREQWRSYNPSSMIAACHDDKLIIAYTKAGGDRGTMILRPRNIAEGVVFSDTYFCAAYQDGLLDSLMVFVPGQKGLCLWNEGDPIPYLWLSRQFILPVPGTFTACRVEADSYDNTRIEIIAKNRTYWQPVTSNKPVRFPSGYADHWFQLGVAGTDTIRRIIVGETVSELQ